MIKNTYDLEHALEEWYALAGPTTWLQFKTHFTLHKNCLCKVRGPTMWNTTFQQSANVIAQLVLAEVKQDMTNAYTVRVC